MLDPMTAAPALASQAATPSPWRISAVETYETQAEAEQVSLAGNMADAARIIRELAADPILLGNRQVTEEMEARLRFLDQHEPGIVADLREALAVIAADPAGVAGLAAAAAEHEALVSEQRAMLAWIQREVAPRREEDCLTVVLTDTTGSLLADLGRITSQDEGGDDAPIVLALTPEDAAHA